MQTILPRDTGKFEEPEKMKQIAEPSNTPLRFNLSEPKRNDEECQDKTNPIKIVIGIFEIGSPFPRNEMKTLINKLLIYCFNVTNCTLLHL